MTKTVPNMLLACAVLLTLMCTGCSISSLDTGGSSGTEVSAISGTVVDQEGAPVANATVRLRPIDFLADSANSEMYLATRSLIDTVTRPNGSYAMCGMLPDSYTVEITVNDSLGVTIPLMLSSSDKMVALPNDTVSPLAEMTGNVQVGYGGDAFGYIQVYGLQRSARPDSMGNFSLTIPSGRHRLHIGAYLPAGPDTSEFDGMDLSVEVQNGEQRNIGSFRMRPPPPPPCLDGSCDSAVVRYILDAAGLNYVRTGEVTRVENGRIVELHLRNRLMQNGIPPDVNKLIELRVLDLGRTGLPFMFPDMGRMSKLEVVRLDGNHIPEFSSSVGNLSLLRELDLYGNELTQLPPSIVQCTGLLFLELSNNRLCALDQAMAAWADRYDSDWRSTQRCRSTKE
ncbi:MAG: hypothetical protein JXA71_15715 [Chitinispirillaceae bacterium]|nr:hypothetical protein [Chitinispirillaceae bacterium]